MTAGAKNSAKPSKADPPLLLLAIVPPIIMLESTFRDTIKRYGLLEKKDKVLLGVSGGPDSICLLHLFDRLKKDYSLRLFCAHFNHGLRPEADEEEQFVAGMCRKLDLEFYSEKKDVRTFFDGDSLEQTARRLRYDFFAKCGRHYRVKKLALAHHKDDLVETVIMRLIRGSGLRGLRGFAMRSKLGPLIVIRPLVNLRKAQITAWLAKEGLEYRLDKSNLEEEFLRNRLRLRLIPLIEEMNPQAVESIASASLAVAQDYDFLYEYSRKAFLALRKDGGSSGIGLALKGLTILHPAVFNNVVRIAVEELKGDTRRLESRHLDEINDLVLNRPAGSIVDLPGFLAVKDAGRIVFRKQR